MHESPMESLPTPHARALAWRDVAVVAGVTVLSFVLSAHFQFTEALYALREKNAHLSPAQAEAIEKPRSKADSMLFDLKFQARVRCEA